MAGMTRRNFLKAAGLTGMATGISLTAGMTQARSGGKVVVVGGGTGGATAARYLKHYNPNLDVTLISNEKTHYTCYFSNLVIGGVSSLDSIGHGYDGLRAAGVKVVYDTATGIDGNARQVSTASGTKYGYDRCIVSPGIDFQWGAIDGYDQAATEAMPHAWKAGPGTTGLLRKQLEAMPDGGTVVIAPPPNPFRCPPGPYERTCLIANYLKENKPRSKVLVIDAKDAFSKQGLFQQAWDRFYNGMIEWLPAAETAGGVRAVDPKNMKVLTEFDEIDAAVANIIPPQKAGKIAQDSGLVDSSGWCPVMQATFESRIVENVHVIGDACIASPMPKSGYAASSQAKVVAAAVAAKLEGREPPRPSYVNTCYSFGRPDHAFSVAAVYRLEGRGDDANIGVVSSGLSPADAPDEYFQREVLYAESWYNNLIAEIFG